MAGVSDIDPVRSVVRALTLYMQLEGLDSSHGFYEIALS